MGKEGKVYRIYNADKTAWVDVLRFSSINFITNNGKQETLFVDWTDGETEPGRLYEERTLLANAMRDPPIPPVKINAIKSINFVKDTKEECWEFVNDPEIATEQREYKYFYAYSLESNDPGKKGMAWDDYKKGLRKATADNTTIVSGMVSGFRVKKNDKEVYYAFETDEITEAFEPTADDTITASVYLDPFQVIVGTSTEEPQPFVPKYFWLYTDFVYNSGLPYPGSHEVVRYSPTWEDYRPGILMAPMMTGFRGYYPAGVYWEFIQFPYHIYDPSFYAERELLLGITYDKNGSEIWFYDSAEQKAWDDFIYSKLVTSITPAYPFRLTNNFNAVTYGWLDTDPSTAWNTVRFGGINVDMTEYSSFDYEAPRVQGLFGALDDYAWYVDPPSMWLTGLRDGGNIDYWNDRSVGTVNMLLSAVPISQQYEECGRIDFSINASYDGVPLEVLGWHCSGISSLYNFDWTDLDPLQGPPYIYASPLLWFRVLCKLPDQN